MARLHYWAVVPASGSLKDVRIERGVTPEDAMKRAFGTGLYPSRLRHLDVGRWRVKDLGTRLSVIQADRRRRALLMAPDGWFDPAV